ncbi:oligosaccharide flippase family protein [Pseudoalteromonas sp.]|uniref:lipopolysaccharide biosynthesis protein n=1 Tax=Pseudoalteromonas sp. TaxID=53249 RepID=UPI001BCB86EA|nr:oligosaccharide flippase family protein [Pseudoalteromonas sp.]
MLKKLNTSQFIRNVVVVASGAAGAQMITMLFMPLITRLYGAEAFGLLGVFTAVLAVISPVAALAYPIAIVLPKVDDDARSIAKLSLLIASVVSIITFIVIFLTKEPLITLFNLQAISSYLLLLPIALFFAATQQIMQQWLIRKKQFKVTARVAVSQSLIMNSLKAAGGAFNPIGAILIFTATLGNALYTMQLWFGAQKWSIETDRINSENSSKSNLKILAHKHRDFPLYRAPQQFINALSQSLPVLLLASLFGPASAGFYTLGKTALGVPSTLIGKAVGDVFYPRITEAAHNKENLFNLIRKATIMLAAAGIVPFGIIIIFGPELFSFVFGTEWVVAGDYARWLSVWLFFMFLNPPSNMAIPILAIQRFYLFFTVFSISLRAAALVTGYYLYESDVISLAFFCTTSAIINALIITIVLFKSYRFNNGKSNG